MVRRIDCYANIINDSRMESFPNINEVMSKKPTHLTQKEAQLDKLKFFSKFYGKDL